MATTTTADAQPHASVVTKSKSTAPLLIVFIIAQRQIVEGIALSGSKT